MSSTVTIRQSKGVGVVGLITLIIGIVFIVAGGITWWTVSDKLSQEGIVVSEDASFLGGHDVKGPLTAYAQADVINKHALEMSDGKTYAELDREDPLRETVMNSSFLRTSLFTSVVSFGVAALVMGLGVVFILVGWALRRLAGGPPVTVETEAVRGAHAKVAEPVVPVAAPVTEAPRAAPVETTPVVPVVDTPPTRATQASTQSPAPAGENVVTRTAPLTPEDSRPVGWESPSDRVPPVEETDSDK